jgi:hypothetical protein
MDNDTPSTCPTCGVSAEFMRKLKCSFWAFPCECLELETEKRIQPMLDRLARQRREREAV